ncbi:hypothetical protein ABPG77_006147 [Micractinium sp. CCAP 211/92]
MLAGRPWDAVEDYYRAIVSAELRDLLGLSLLDAPQAGAETVADRPQSSELDRLPAAEPAGDAGAAATQHSNEQQQQQQQQQQQLQFVKQSGGSIEQTVGGALRALLSKLQASSGTACGAASNGVSSHVASRNGLTTSDDADTTAAAVPAVVLSVAGRTDRGVSALGQLVLGAINAARPGLLRAWHVESVPRSFHASFKAQWRRYLYLLPLRSADAATAAAIGLATAGAATGNAVSPAGAGEERTWDFDPAAVQAAPDIDPDRVGALLAPLEGRALDYKAFARDTPPGKDCVCRLLRARAWRTSLPDPQSTPVLAFELIGTRFLRRMVRVLVATAVREALPQAAWFSSSCGDTCGGSAAGSSCAVAGATATAEPGGHDKGCHVAGAAEAAAKAAAGWDAGGLLWAAASKDRRVTAAPAPAEGLLFLEAGYSPLPI